MDHALDDGSTPPGAAVQWAPSLLSTSETQFAQVIEASPSALVIVDATGAIRMVNRQTERLFGYPREALLGQSLEMLMPQRFRTRHTMLRETFTADGPFYPMGHGQGLFGLRRDGTEIPLETCLNQISIDGCRMVLAAVLDLTERRAIEAAKEAAEQANLAKSRFVALVSHELRTPLNGILGYAQLLAMDGGLTPLQQQRVGAMTRACRHLLRLIEHVLDYSAIEADRIELHPVHIAASALAETCLEFVRPNAMEKGLDLRLVVAGNAPQGLIVDPARLRQVVINLLGNAVKFTTTGWVDLRLLAGQAGGFRLEVADTGAGIPPDKRDRLFREFERLSPVSTSEGAGLGLAISMRFVRLMEGNIGYLPNPTGGSIFWLELPASCCADRPEDTTDGGLQTPGAPQVTQTLQVLVVDDMAMNRDVVGSFLRAAGHDPVLVSSGEQAVIAASEHDFDAILMDVRMPEMDGLEATRRIRGLAGPRGKVPVIALTAQALAGQIDECLAAGMTTHLAKPVQYESLLQMLHDVVAAAGQRDAAAPVTDSDAADEGPPVLDVEALQRTARFLTDADLVLNLDRLRQLIVTLLTTLSLPAGPDTSGAVETAHTVAGTAGTFGFMRLSDSARQFEQALLDRTSQAEPHLANLLREARTALDHLVAEGLIAVTA